jgi:hypothetical protein
VPPLHVPESSPAQLAQPRHSEQTQSGALTETSSEEVAGGEYSSDELYESSRAGSPKQEYETDARTDARNVLTGQHAPIGLNGARHHTWSQQVLTTPSAGGANHTQNEFATEATSCQSSKNTDEVPRTHNAAESAIEDGAITKDPHPRGLATRRPSVRQAPNPNAIAHEPRCGEGPAHDLSNRHTQNPSWTLQDVHPVKSSTRNLPVRQTQTSEPAGPFRPAMNDHMLTSDTSLRTSALGTSDTLRERAAQFNEPLERNRQKAKQRSVNPLPPYRPELHHLSPRDVYKPSRAPRSESPIIMDSSRRESHTSGTLENRQRREDSAQTGKLSIRDGSRARSAVPADLSGEICDLCHECGHRRYFCNVCAVVFCDPCWEAQFIHRTKRSNPGSLPHEKTDPHVAKKIGGVLNPQLKEEQREKLHHDDIDTTWFGVVREGGEHPVFQDYGRYADLVAGVKDLRLGSVSALSTSSDYSEALYPSLVSFVGETGAGKSSLIKLIIDLKSDEDEPFETPVVGAAGRDVATSEDVHLYLDPDSSESQAPLLFADCEGLNGGERDPVGAKLKRKMASSQKNGSNGRRKPTSERELVWADTAKKQSRDFAVAHLYPRLLYTFSDVIVFVVKNPR